MIEDIKNVAQREFGERVRDRGFLLMTAFFLVIVAAGGIFGGTLTGGSEEESYTVAVATADQRAEALGTAMEEQASAAETDLTLERFDGASAAEGAVTQGEADLAITGASQITADGQPDSTLESLAQSSAQSLQVGQLVQDTGVPAAEAQAALDPEPLTVQNATADEQASGPEPGAILVAIGGTVLLFITVFTYGYWIANGVVEEKSSRVAEVVLSAIKPARVLAGKIIGIGLLGLCQLLAVAGLGLVAALIADFELPPGAYGAAGSVLLWFVLGAIFYGLLFAVAGALVSRNEDLQYTTQPMMLLLFVGYGASIYLPNNPDSAVVGVLSYLPPFSPVIVPVRMAFGEMGAVGYAVAVAFMVATTVGLAALAARLYTGSMLRFGSRVRLGEAWRSSGASATDTSKE